MGIYARISCVYALFYTFLVYKAGFLWIARLLVIIGQKLVYLYVAKIELCRLHKL